MTYFCRSDRFPEEASFSSASRPSTAVRRHVKRISEEFTITQTRYENSIKSNSGILINIEPTSDFCKNNSYPDALNSIFFPKTEKNRNKRKFFKKFSACSKCGSSKNQVMPMVSPPPTRAAISESSLRKEMTQRPMSTSSHKKCSARGKERHSISLSPPSPSIFLRGRENCNPVRTPRRRKIRSAAAATGGVLKLPFEQVKKAKLFTENAVRVRKLLYN